jgi:acyl-[acyl-carrier-protein]-phospholipid O-acyltransferase/long-chain-fatty-acid--[acyl-carrier-protein] ligase
MSSRSRTPIRERAGHRGFAPLLAAHFLGAFNDNLLKMVISLIAAGGVAAGAGGAAYLSLTGVVFVAPYLLFSGWAGSLADACDKRLVLVSSKVFEIGVMVLAACGLAERDLDLLLLALFLAASQATFFGPARYGIVPDLVPPKRLSRANGALEACRQTAVILGTIAGGILLGSLGDRPGAIGAILIALAFAGALASFGIGAPSPTAGSVRVSWHPWRGIAAGIAGLRADRRLALAVLGITWFDFLSTVALLDVLLVAKDVMGLGHAATGLLAGAGGLGVAAGALLVGRFSGARAEIGIVPVAGVGVGAALVALTFCTGSLAAMAAGMVALGLCGGVYIVPLYARLQRESDPAERGRVIGTNNVLNMAGVLAGSGLLWLVVDRFGLTPVAVLFALGLACVGLMAATSILRCKGHAASAPVEAFLARGRPAAIAACRGIRRSTRRTLVSGSYAIDRGGLER